MASVDRTPQEIAEQMLAGAGMVAVDHPQTGDAPTSLDVHDRDENTDLDEVDGSPGAWQDVYLDPFDALAESPDDAGGIGEPGPLSDSASASLDARDPGPATSPTSAPLDPTLIETDQGDTARGAAGRSRHEQPSGSSEWWDETDLGEVDEFRATPVADSGDSRTDWVSKHHREGRLPVAVVAVAVVATVVLLAAIVARPNGSPSRPTSVMPPQQSATLQSAEPQRGLPRVSRTRRQVDRPSRQGEAEQPPRLASPPRPAVRRSRYPGQVPPAVGPPVATVPADAVPPNAARDGAASPPAGTEWSGEFTP